MSSRLEEVRERFAEVHARGKATIETTKRILALLRQSEHDAGDQPDDSAEALAAEDRAAAAR